MTIKNIEKVPREVIRGESGTVLGKKNSRREESTWTNIHKGLSFLFWLEEN